MYSVEERALWVLGRWSRGVGFVGWSGLIDVLVFPLLLNATAESLTHIMYTHVYARRQLAASTLMIGGQILLYWTLQDFRCKK